MIVEQNLTWKTMKKHIHDNNVQKIDLDFTRIINKETIHVNMSRKKISKKQRDIYLININLIIN